MTSVRILLVDDNPQIHQDFRSIFSQNPDEKRGRLYELFQRITGVEASRAHSVPKKKYFELESAFQGEEACTMVRQSIKEGRPYSLAFVDVRMPPGMDGIQTINKMWDIDPEIQVVICTAYSDRSWEEIFHLLAPEDNLLILKKPFDLSEVLQITHTMSKKWNTSKALKESNERLTRANEVLENVVQQQQSKMIESYKLAHLGELASGVAHELNTPITVIKLRAQQIKRLLGNDATDTDKVRDFVDVIDSTCERMTKIVASLLHAGREPKREEKDYFAIKDILDSAILLCTDRFKNHNIKLHIDVPPDLLVFCSSVQLSQVFLNLISNSFYSVLELQEKWIRIEAVTTRQDIVITVTDSGKRIADDLAHKIMQPFFTTKPAGKGTGLGLSISCGIIQQHGGVLELDMDHKNMSFKVILPNKKQEHT